MEGGWLWLGTVCSQCTWSPLQPCGCCFLPLAQSFQEVAVHLPFPSQVVELVLEYLYSDGIDDIHSELTASVIVWCGVDW